MRCRNEPALHIQPTDALWVGHAELVGLEDCANGTSGGNRMLAHELAVCAEHAAEVLRPWSVGSHIPDGVPDLQGAEPLRFRWETHHGVNLSRREETDGLVGGRRDEGEVLLRIKAHVGD